MHGPVDVIHNTTLKSFRHCIVLYINNDYNSNVTARDMKMFEKPLTSLHELHRNTHIEDGKGEMDTPNLLFFTLHYPDMRVVFSHKN